MTQMLLLRSNRDQQPHFFTLGLSDENKVNKRVNLLYYYISYVCTVCTLLIFILYDTLYIQYVYNVYVHII